ncbi:hypothetical protein [Hyphococcus sp.]|uniref:hypothetical protein n=1 Tax=Hyphococcus sp. TaxID=2038636 RepID=UPI003CCB7800
MEQLSAFFAELLDWAREGYEQINALQGLIIALYATSKMAYWSRVFVVAVSASIVHAIADFLLPAIVNDTAPNLPPILEGDYWKYLAVLYLGYVVLITLFYTVRRTLMK